MASEDKTTVGVAFSGGGIRSAALCSGVLRRLLEKSVNIDYLSCVSGGGFCGASYLDWKFRHDGIDDPKWHEQFFKNMRKRCGIVCDWTNPFRGILDTVVLISLLFFVVAVVPVLNVAAPCLPIAFVVDFLVGEILRQGFICPDSETKLFNSSKTFERNPGLNETVIKISNMSGSNECVPFVNEGMYFTYILFTVLLLATAFFYIFTTMLDPNGFLYSKVKFIFFAFLISFAFTFTPWLIEEYISVIPRSVSIGLLVFAILLWVCIPYMRDKIFWAILIYVYSYVIKWRVYKTNIVGIEYHEHSFNVMLWLSAILLWITPYVYAIQRVSVQTFSRWKFQRAFFESNNIGAFGCAGISLTDCFPSFDCCTSSSHHLQNRALYMGDLKEVNPAYICNLLVGNWVKDPLKEEHESYSLLSVTPNTIERIDSKPGEDLFYGRLHPEDLKVSDMMASSAAVLSGNMGLYQINMDTIRDIQMILGINMGRSLVAQSVKRGNTSLSVTYFLSHYILPLVIQSVIVAPVILLPIIEKMGYDEMYEHILVALILFTVSCLFLIALAPTGGENSGVVEKIIRWCILNIQQIRLIREISGVVNYGPVPPTILSLSDGGHVENLGILPLLKRRCKRILVVNGGYSSSDTAIANDLIIALNLARKWLRCSFSGKNGRDVIEDIKDHYVLKAPGIQPRTYSFKVEYFTRPYGYVDDVKIGEGEIQILSPRHPFKGTPNQYISSWEEYNNDTNQHLDPEMWGSGPDLSADETDRLTFGCCECCHDLSCRRCSAVCFGTFPFHFTSHQFFTPEMFSVYHREGYKASLDGTVECFLDPNIRWPRDNTILIQRLNEFECKDSSFSTSDID
ncbi:uncharacterized protein LOC114521456 isoform X2 [Dendronephthya gigantea]|nr:uncharacterized protein LOC114521456 isoform X2 [Dendronephthya gigantea]